MRSITVLVTIAIISSFCYIVTLHRDQPEKNELLRIANFINKNNFGWKAHYYDHFNFESHEMLHVGGGAFEDDLSLLKEKEFNSNLKLEEPPKNFDSREKWPKCESIKEIRDQSKCGSCWAFSSATAISDRVCIHSNQELQTRISPSHINSCCFRCGNGCRGGFITHAYNFWLYDGIVTGNSYGQDGFCYKYPFPHCKKHLEESSAEDDPCNGMVFDTPPCKAECEADYPTSYKKDKHFAAEVYVIKGIDNIKQELFENGPVSVKFDVFTDFRTYKEGIYIHQTGDKVGGHAVRLIGYGEQEVDGVSTPYWIVANSWGALWGENGYFKIKHGECKIDEYAVGGIPKLN